MEEIKEYLEKKKDQAANEVIAYSASGLFSAFMTKEKRVNLKVKLEASERKYKKVKKMLQCLEEKSVATSTENIAGAYVHLSHLLMNEIERETSSIDVQKNEMFARLRVSELEFAHSQLKSSLWTYESQKYL
ncbi:hypothetical protein [Brumimicrobium mesophilum]|uniref:hypothetical protein n=1 Tax=Brumimicrobium mesophilum TaxID=392717 RepID=UPI00131E5268|nr:hypothetical protein [Brumimicrobium mesophilum]